LSSSSGAPTGLSEVRWTRTTVGGPNYLGGSITARARPWAVTSAQTRPDITGRAGLTLNYFGSCRAWAVLFFVLRAGPSGPAQMYTYIHDHHEVGAPLGARVGRG
jgi:hypothetical protein